MRGHSASDSESAPGNSSTNGTTWHLARILPGRVQVEHNRVQLLRTSSRSTAIIFNQQPNLDGAKPGRRRARVRLLDEQQLALIHLKPRLRVGKCLPPRYSPPHALWWVLNKQHHLLIKECWDCSSILSLFHPSAELCFCTICQSSFLLSRASHNSWVRCID